MFKNPYDVLTMMEPEAKVKSYTINNCMMYEFKTMELEVHIGTINETYPMESISFLEVLALDEHDKQRKMESFVDSYVKALNKYDHHCLLDVYDLTQFYGADHLKPFDYHHSKYLGDKPIDKRIVGDGKEYIKQKINELKQYK
jgi:hypothetical protein